MYDIHGKKLFSCTLSVRWGDMDAYRHVNNALYLRYLEEAQVQLLATLGSDMTGVGTDPMVINVGCTFLRPVTYPDTLTIDCYVADPGRSSFMTYYEIFSEHDKSTPVSQGHSKIVWVNHQTGRSVPLPDHIRAQMS